MSGMKTIVRAAGLFAQGALILGLSALLIVATLEIWARVQPRRYFVEFDPVLGFRNEPGASGVYRGRWFLATNPEIDAPVAINRLGLRAPERTPEKPDGIRRLMILGDSFVQAFEVPWSATLHARLEERARSTDDASALEVFPMGVNGYGQAQQLLWLRKEGIAWDPDFVLLILFLGNDLSDNSREIGAGASRPYFELVDGRLVQVAEPSDAARAKYWIADHLRSYLLFRELAVRFDGLRSIADRLGWVNTSSRGARHGEEANRRVRRAWALTLALVEEIAAESRAHGAGFALAFHGHHATGSEETDRERLARFCAGAGMSCLDLSAQLDGAPENFIPDDDHWTARGHQRVADLLWERWGEELLGATDTEEGS